TLRLHLSSTLFPYTTLFRSLVLGTSIPIVPLPGIGAIIRIPNADKDKAMSSSRFLILEILTPASGMISYKVTVGVRISKIKNLRSEEHTSELQSREKLVCRF